MFNEHAIVVLKSDLPESGLRIGDVGTVVFVHGQGKAYEVEFVDGSGATVALLTLNSNAIREIGAGELLHIRRLDLTDQDLASAAK